MLTNKGVYLIEPLSQLNTSLANGSNMTVQAASQKVAIKIFAEANYTINSFDIRLGVTGTTTGITIKGHIETDSGNAPSGTVVGSSTPAFNCPASGAWVGLQTFAAGAALTQGNVYWLILEDGGGTAPTASNFYQLQTTTLIDGSAAWDGGVMRQFNGTNWTTTASLAGECAYVIQDSNSNFYGTPLRATGAQSARTSVFSTNRIGIRFKLGVKAKIWGGKIRVRINGSPPNGLEIVLQQQGGGTPLDVATLPAVGSLVTGNHTPFFFPNTPTVPAGTLLYALMHQVSDGGISANSYSVNATMVQSAYISALATADVREVSGTLVNNNSDPSTLTVQTDEIPFINLIISDPAVDLIGGGGLLVHPGLAGGMRG